MQLIASHRVSFGPLEFPEGRARKTIAPADGSDADAVVDEFSPFVLTVLPQEPEESPDFCGRSLPVVAGECEQGQRRDAEVRGAFDNVSNRVHARDVTPPPGASSHTRPPAIAVHDDGDMNSVQVRSSASRVSVKIVSICWR